MTSSLQLNGYGYDNGMPLKSDAPIEKVADWNYNNAITPFQEFWQEADLDKKCVLGDQRNLNNYIQDYDYQKFVFNESMKLRNMITGHQRRTRKGSRIIPVESSDSQTASQLTTAIQYAFTKDNVYNTISDSFTGGIDVGLNLLHIYLDYSEDPISGDIKVDNLGYNTFIMDPWWTRLDLSDCGFIYTRKYLTREMVKRRLPDHEEQIMLLPESRQSGFDNKFNFMPEQFQSNRRNLMAYDEYWYKTERKAKFIVDSESYETIELTDEESKSPYFARFMDDYPEAEIIETMVPTVNLAIMVQGQKIYDGPNPLKIDRYPFAVTVCYMSPSSIKYAYRFQGVIRGSRDSQYLYNHWMELKMGMLESMFNGEHFEEDALVDDEQAFFNGPGKKRFFKKGRLGAYMESPGSRVDGSVFQATADLRDSIQSITGVTPELMGSSDTDVGITQMLRQGAGLTTLQTPFDNLDLTQRHLTNVAVEIMQQNWTIGKFRRVIGEEPSFDIKSKIFSKYDTQVENAELTSTSQQMGAIQLLEMVKMGFSIPPEMIIKKLSLQDKDELIEVLEQQAQAQSQAQQLEMQLKLENQQIINDNLKTSAASEAALAEKRLAQMDSQRMIDATKIQEALAERERANLDRIKGIKELAEIDLNQLEKLISILKNIEGSVDAETERVLNVAKQGV